MQFQQDSLSINGLKAWANRGIDISISIHFLNPYTIGKLSIVRVKTCNFSWIGRKTEELEHLKVQKMTLHGKHTWSLYCGQVRTGSDRFGPVWTSQNRCEALFFLNQELHAGQIWPTPKTCVQFSNRIWLDYLRPSEVVETALRHASIGVRCELV